MPLSGHDDVALFESLNQCKIENYAIIASLKGETMGKLKNRIPGSRLLISSLPGSAVVMGGTLAPAIFKPEKNLVFFRIKSRVPEMPPLVSLSDSGLVYDCDSLLGC